MVQKVKPWCWFCKRKQPCGVCHNDKEIVILEYVAFLIRAFKATSVIFLQCFVTNFPYDKAEDMFL